MWAKIASLILRNRALMLALVVITTGFWAYMAATRLHFNHKFATMLPEDDSLSIIYRDMQGRFGEDGMVMVIGINDKELYTLKKFNAWMKMGHDLKKVKGVDSVFSVAHMFDLRKDTTYKKFSVEPLTPRALTSQADLDSIKEKIHSLPFYNGLLYNDSTGASLMMVFINSKKFNSEERGNTIPEVVEVAEKYNSEFPDLHYSGMPYIRDRMYSLLKSEVNLFVALSALVTIVIIFIFFRSIRVLIACMCVVVVGVIWSFGTIAAFGFEVSQLMALIPSLMIVIAIPNCVYLITKYHQEFIRTKNRVRALSGVIQKIGVATFMTNATTAAGFGTFILTSSDKLIEFGIVAAFNVMALFFLSLIIIPVVFSFMKDPSVKHTKHLEKKWVTISIDTLVWLVSKKRWMVYVGSGIIVAVGIYGITRMQITGNITEDLPETSVVKKDLKFIEDNFGGMVPFEVIIDFKTKGQIQKNLKKIEAIQEYLNADSMFSKSLSIVDAVKFVNQAFHGGNPEEFKIIEKRKMSFMKPYLDDMVKGKKSAGIKGFIDSTETRARITVQVKDIHANKLFAIEERLMNYCDSVLNPDRKQIDSLAEVIVSKSGTEKDSLLFFMYDNYPRVYSMLAWNYSNNDSSMLDTFDLGYDRMAPFHAQNDFNEKLKKSVKDAYFTTNATGISVVYARGTDYLVWNLISSLIFAIVLIAALMAIVFRSLRMVFISMIPNMVPLIITAGLMGYFGIPIKPSTILIFSIALGISVDDAIHYLAKYRQELKTGKSIGESAILSIRESGVSMMYTSIVLFFSFLIFIFSEFGGTIALGYLISITLGVAMFCNLIILPTLLMTLDKLVTTKAFREPLIEIFDEEVDEELSEIQVRKDSLQ
ncbi:MAG: efflux RND transporter permease subunit [Bacteroidota bacterium]